MKRLFIIPFFLIIICMMSCGQQNTNVFTYKVGDCEVILLSENQGQGDTKILIGATPEMISETLPEGTFSNAVNAFLVKTPQGNYLIDTGFGRNLFENLSSVGVTPDDVQQVIITHMHGDHISGLLKDGEVMFPKSKLVLSKVEHTYWSEIKSNQKALDVLKMYEKNISLIEPLKVGEKTEDMISFIDAPGHTPGQILCLVQSKGEQLLIWADLAHAMAIQMPYPEVAVTYDVDPELAVKSRKEVLKYVTQNNIPVAGMHIAYPGMGKVEAISAGSYRFISAE
ncbi:MAG: MBL fold metallo-hydrolase [Bacteroides sp.]|nr:MBL fold metallo-hydrolase [Bacteroides sp.]